MTTVTLEKKRKREDEQRVNAPTKKVAIKAPSKQGRNLELPTQPQPELENRPKGGKVTVATDDVTSVQIVTGSYEKVLHGIHASLPSRLIHGRVRSDKTYGDPDGDPDVSDVTFSDTFLFTAHASSMRCLALSPATETGKRILATGSSDESINLYNISSTPPPKTESSSGKVSLPTLTSNVTTSENPRNRSLGTLLHHDRAITNLHFQPGSNKLFSSAEDNTISISRTRDWALLSSIKAPIPKPQGRPSGDTAGPGEVPAGINDFAIHPSQKLMLSVGKGERCLRLWNLMTGKKAGVLNFDRNVLAQAGEGKFGGGEGRKVLWDAAGENYVVGFERGAVLFGLNSKPKAIIKSSPSTKLHQMRFLPSLAKQLEDVLAISTEDGRLLFFDLNVSSNEELDSQDLPACPCVAQIGGRTAGVTGRIKDFEILQLASTPTDTDESVVLVTGSSDGVVRLWNVFAGEIAALRIPEADDEVNGVQKANGGDNQSKQVGHLVGRLETGYRITCLGAFVMEGEAYDGAVAPSENGEAEEVDMDEDESGSENEKGDDQ